MHEAVLTSSLPLIYRSLGRGACNLNHSSLKAGLTAAHIANFSGVENNWVAAADSSSVLTIILAMVAGIPAVQLLNKRLFYDVTKGHVAQADRIYVEPDASCAEKVRTVSEELRKRGSIFVKPVSGKAMHDGLGILHIARLDGGDYSVYLQGTHLGDCYARTQIMNTGELQERLQAYFTTLSSCVCAVEQAIPSVQLPGGHLWESRFVMYRPTVETPLQHLGSATRLSGENARTVSNACGVAETEVMLRCAITNSNLARDVNDIASSAHQTLTKAQELVARCARLYTEALADAVEFILGHRPPNALCEPSQFMTDVVYVLQRDKAALEPYMMEIQLRGGLDLFSQMHPDRHELLVNSRPGHRSGVLQVLDWLATTSPANNSFAQAARLKAQRRKINIISRSAST